MNHAITVNDRIALRRESPPERQIRIDPPALIEIDDAQPVGTLDFSPPRSEVAAEQLQ